MWLTSIFSTVKVKGLQKRVGFTGSGKISDGYTACVCSGISDMLTGRELLIDTECCMHGEQTYV